MNYKYKSAFKMSCDASRDFQVQRFIFIIFFHEVTNTNCTMTPTSAPVKLLTLFKFTRTAISDSVFFPLFGKIFDFLNHLLFSLLLFFLRLTPNDRHLKCELKNTNINSVCSMAATIVYSAFCLDIGTRTF